MKVVKLVMALLREILIGAKYLSLKETQIIKTYAHVQQKIVKLGTKMEADVNNAKNIMQIRGISASTGNVMNKMVIILIKSLMSVKNAMKAVKLALVHPKRNAINAQNQIINLTQTTKIYVNVLQKTVNSVMKRAFSAYNERKIIINKMEYVNIVIHPNLTTINSIQSVINATLRVQLVMGQLKNIAQNMQKKIYAKDAMKIANLVAINRKMSVQVAYIKCKQCQCNIENCEQCISQDENTCRVCKDNFTLVERGKICQRKKQCKVENCLQQCSLDSDKIFINCQNAFQLSENSRFCEQDQNYQDYSQIFHSNTYYQNNFDQIIEVQITQISREDYSYEIKKTSEKQLKIDLFLNVTCKDKRIILKIKDESFIQQNYLSKTEETMALENYVKLNEKQKEQQKNIEVASQSITSTLVGTIIPLALLGIFMSFFISLKILQLIPIKAFNEQITQKIRGGWEYSGFIDLVWTVYLYVLVSVLLQVFTFEIYDNSSHINYILFALCFFAVFTFPIKFTHIIYKSKNSKDDTFLNQRLGSLIGGLKIFNEDDLKKFLNLQNQNEDLENINNQNLKVKKSQIQID
ncbi:hypothetical protein ABPG72_008877 [Tetrahymena utriculariae]